jgi:hypothetical protein
MSVPIGFAIWMAGVVREIATKVTQKNIAPPKTREAPKDGYAKKTPGAWQRYSGMTRVEKRARAWGRTGEAKDRGWSGGWR